MPEDSSIDPTKNVLELVEASIKRIDDLHAAETRRVDERFRCNKELATAESERVNQILAMRAEHERELREAEAKRIDAIRNVDVNAMAVANERGAAQIAAIAAQVAALTAAQATSSGSGAGKKDVWGYIAVGISAMVGIGGLVIAAIVMGK